MCCFAGFGVGHDVTDFVPEAEMQDGHGAAIGRPHLVHLYYMYMYNNNNGYYYHYVI